MFDQTRPSSRESIQAVKRILEDETTQLFTSCDVITTLYYLLSRKREDIALDAVEYVNTISTVVEFGNMEVTKSFRLMKQNKKFTDLEDTIQYVMAKKVKADLILSNDRGFVSDGIEVMSAAAFAKRMQP